MDGEPRDLGIVPGQTGKIVGGETGKLALPKELSVDEIQKAIIGEILTKLTDPNAVALVYPQQYPLFHQDFDDLVRRKPLDDELYTEGSRVLLVGLSDSRMFGDRDETFVFLVDNSSKTNSQTKGQGRFTEDASGEHSTREIGLRRLRQTREDKSHHTGTYWGLNLSENANNRGATFSLKGKAEAHILGLTFLDMWNDGQAQLSPKAFLEADPEFHLNFTAADYRDILDVLRKSKTDKGGTNRASKFQQGRAIRARVLSLESRQAMLPSGAALPPPPSEKL
ncbi:MAG TPA: hypothetical protein VLE91_03815 [Candidatus Saccharimonadales bacterium]|nr:hypothetical protein [Candidatus Saccharimonadales bacterium]